MQTSALTTTLWWGGLVIQLGIACAMVYRRLYRELPIFFGYTVFIVLRTVFLLTMKEFGAYHYFYAYWGTEIISWALGLAVIQEVMQRLFAPYPSVQRLVLLLFRWGAALLITIAVFAAYAAPGSEPERLMAGILLLERGVRLVQAGLLSLLFLFAGFLRLRWPHYVFGIALGLGIFSTVELANITVFTHDMWMRTLFVTLKPLAFVVAQVVWMYYLAVPETAPAYQPGCAPEVEGWDGALAELLNR